MTAIDYDRLELVLGSFIDESCINDFDIPAICRNATIKEYNGRDAIHVKSTKFAFIFDLETYEQLHGAGY